MDGSASGPDVVEKDVSGGRVDFGFGAEGVGGGGLGEASCAVGTDLNGVLGASKNRL